MIKFLIVLALAILCASCSASDSDKLGIGGAGGNKSTNATTVSTYPDPAPPGIWDPNKPQPYAIFDLPKGWERSNDNSSLIFSTDTQGPGIKLSLGAITQPEQGTTSEQSRDQRLDYLSQDYCLKMGGNGYGVNCDKGFKKESLALGGRQLYLLHYYGVMGDMTVPVAEIFWKGDNAWMEGMAVGGDFQKAKSALEKLIQTLHYEYRIPSEFFKKQ